MSGTLFICPTPIGNLEDITLRVINTLKQVDYIAAEDTRITQRLLKHYDIDKPTTSYYKFNEKKKTDYLINLLKQGQKIALVSDAGTPGISDPGEELIKVAIDNKIDVITLPGPNAVIASLVVSGIKTSPFIYLGFLPKKSQAIKAELSKYINSGLTIVFYESPKRLIDTLELIVELFNNPKIAIIRELTKKYEEVKRGLASDVLNYFKSKSVLGEIVVILEAKENNAIKEIDNNAIKIIDALSKLNISKKEIAKIASEITGIKKNSIYEYLVKG